jgi:hypothetical protein
VISTPVAIVVYSTQWITISSCAPVITNCPYKSVSISMVPIITLNLSNNPLFPPPFTPAGKTVVPTPTSTPGNGAVVPGNSTTQGNGTIITVASGAAGNRLAWTPFLAVGLLFLGIVLA